MLNADQESSAVLRSEVVALSQADVWSGGDHAVWVNANRAVLTEHIRGAEQSASVEVRADDFTQRILGLYRDPRWLLLSPSTQEKWLALHARYFDDLLDSAAREALDADELALANAIQGRRLPVARRLMADRSEATASALAMAVDASADHYDVVVALRKPLAPAREQAENLRGLARLKKRIRGDAGRPNVPHLVLRQRGGDQELLVHGEVVDGGREHLVHFPVTREQLGTFRGIVDVFIGRNGDPVLRVAATRRQFFTVRVPGLQLPYSTVQGNLSFKL